MEHGASDGPPASGTAHDGPPASVDRDDAAPVGLDAQALAATALGDDPALLIAFWRARAEELATRLAQLEQRMAALGARLPSRWAALLTCDPADMPDVVTFPDPLAGWNETTELEEARVASVLPRLWRRLERDA